MEFATPKEAAAAATASRSRADDDAWLPQGAASAVASRAASRSAEDASSSRLFAGAGQRIDGGDPLALEEEVDPMPWRRRVKGGVKYTAPPYGCERIRLVGEAAPGKPLAQPLSGVAPALLLCILIILLILLIYIILSIIIMIMIMVIIIKCYYYHYDHYYDHHYGS